MFDCFGNGWKYWGFLDWLVVVNCSVFIEVGVLKIEGVVLGVCMGNFVGEVLCNL